MKSPVPKPVFIGTRYVPLSVVIPAYNEASRGLENRLHATLSFLKDYCPAHELIVVDDGSHDSTPTLLRDLSEREPSLRPVLLTRNHGKGGAVREGLIRSRGTGVLFMDADLATPLEEIPRFIELLDREADVVIGSRGLSTSVLEKRESPLREGSGKLYNRIAQALVLPGIWDTQCGFKLFKGNAVRALAPSLVENSYGFDVELLYLARASGFQVVEAPVHWTHQPNSRLRFFKDGWAMLLALIRISWKKRSGQYIPAVEAIRERFTALGDGEDSP